MNERRQLEAFDSRQLESLRVFHEVASALTSNLDLDSLLRTIMQQMKEYFKPEQWSLLMVDEEPHPHELYFALSEGIPEEDIRDVRLPVGEGEGVAGHVAATGDPLVVPDVNLDSRWSYYAIENPQLHLHSIICLPIRHGDRTLAVLQLHNSKLDRLPDSSISFLRVLCDYAAIALENARNVKLIHDLSITDDCTGLFNARCLYDMLEAEIEQVSDKRVVSIQPRHFSLLFLDLDHFKSINDTHGHQVGSRLLAEVAGVIKRVLGPQHSAFRYGGDEFVALLRGLDTPAATLLAEELRRELNENAFLTAMDLSIHVSGSFGLATFPQNGDSLHAIIRCADALMYRAKAEGRNRLAVADPRTPPTLPIHKTSRHS